MAEASFPCSKCGVCCKNLQYVGPLAAFDDGAGRCIHLTEDNLCAIYEQRPLVCNVMALYRAQFADAMSEAEWISLNQEACRTLQDRYQAD